MARWLTFSQQVSQMVLMKPCYVQVVEVNVLRRTKTCVILCRHSSSHPPAGFRSLSEAPSCSRNTTFFFSWVLRGCTRCGSGSESTRSRQVSPQSASADIPGQFLLSSRWNCWAALCSGNTISSSNVPKLCRDWLCSVQIQTPAAFYWLSFLVSLAKPGGIFTETGTELPWTICTEWTLFASSYVGLTNCQRSFCCNFNTGKTAYLTWFSWKLKKKFCWNRKNLRFGNFSQTWKFVKVTSIWK